MHCPRREEGSGGAIDRGPLARLKVPEIDADMVIPVTVWLPPPR
jgi:hypothetical protein